MKVVKVHKGTDHRVLHSVFGVFAVSCDSERYLESTGSESLAERLQCFWFDTLCVTRHSRFGNGVIRGLVFVKRERICR